MSDRTRPITKDEFNEYIRFCSTNPGSKEFQEFQERLGGTVIACVDCPKKSCDECGRELIPIKLGPCDVCQSMRHLIVITEGETT